MLKRLWTDRFEERVEKEVSRRMDEWYKRRWEEEKFEDIYRRLSDLEENVHRLSSPIGVTKASTPVISPSGTGIAYTDSTTCTTSHN